MQKFKEYLNENSGPPRVLLQNMNTSSVKYKGMKTNNPVRRYRIANRPEFIRQLFLRSVMLV